MKIQRRNKAKPEFTLAPMVDVILLLLIFFMLTSTAANQSSIDVNLPKAETDDTNQAPSPLAVTIKSDGTFYVDEKPTPTQELEQNIVAMVENSGSPFFTIRADENSLHKDVVHVMEIAEKHHYNIAIATIKE